VDGGSPGNDTQVVACDRPRGRGSHGHYTPPWAPGLTRVSLQLFVPVARSDAGYLKVLHGTHPKVQRHNRQAALQANMSSQTPATTNGSSRRLSAASRFPTAPAVVTMNGHFASVGEAPSKEQYEHGIQVIDEEKEFKHATTCTEGYINTNKA
jgi:light-regulated signal transduction histidine kinase (bacteriophytochrome)